MLRSFIRKRWFLLALGGAEVFELVGMKGDLGALVLGVLIADHVKAEEIAKAMLTFKDLFLLGFFLSIGLSGHVSLETLLIAVLLISALFLAMIRQFLMAIFLAGIFSAFSYPIYSKFETWFGKRRLLASVVTIILIVCVVFIPLTGLLGIIAAQAVKVGAVAKPWIEQQLSKPGDLSQFFHFFNSLTQTTTCTLLVRLVNGNLAR